MVTQTDILHDYCNAGFKLIPLRSKGKIPVLKGWQNKASSSIDQIESWRREFNTDNFGLVTGDLNGIFALDIDVKDGAQGFKSMKKLIKKHGHLPTTPIQKTASGGYHYLFKKPAWLDLRNSASTIAPGIDIRGYNGQIVIAPSSIQGVGRYEWLKGKSILEIPIAEAPEWLLDLIVQAAQEKKTKSKKIFHDGQKIREGEGRNQALISFAGTLRSRGIEENAMLDMLKAYNQAQFDPPLDEYEVMQIWNSVQRYALGQEIKKEIKLIEEVEPIPLPKREKACEFPVTVFPKKTREFIEIASKGLQTKPDLLGLHTICALGSAIGNSRQIVVKDDWTQKANLYACLIARPGSAKSRAQELATEPIEELQNEAFEAYHAKTKEYGLEYDTYENELNQWKKENGRIEERPEEPTRPLLNHYFLTNSTTERLIQILEYNHRGISFIFDELNAWLQSMGQYKGGKGPDKELYLSLWSSRTIKVDRVKDDGKSVNVPKPFVSVFGNLPPDELPKMVTSEGSTGEGFIDRVLFAYPEEESFPYLSKEGVPQWVKTQYKQIVHKLYSLQPVADMDGYMQPADVVLSNAAWNLFEAWYNQQVDEMNSEGFQQRLVGVWRKMENQLARLTLIIHQLRFVEGEADEEFEVDDVSMACGLELVEYFKAHARKVYGQLGKTKIDQKVLDAVDFIKKQGGEVKKRDIQRKRIAGCKKASEVDKLFEELRDFGYGRIEKVKSSKGGPPSKVFKLFF